MGINYIDNIHHSYLESHIFSWPWKSLFCFWILSWQLNQKPISNSCQYIAHIFPCFIFSATLSSLSVIKVQNNLLFVKHVSRHLVCTFLSFFVSPLMQHCLYLLISSYKLLHYNLRGIVLVNMMNREMSEICSLVNNSKSRQTLFLKIWKYFNYGVYYHLLVVFF